MTTFIKLLVAAGLATAKTIPIQVGNGGLKFTPNTTQAAVNDVLVFQFYPMNHSVVGGDFSNACNPAMTGGFFSGWMPTPMGTTNNNTFSVTINDTNPIAFYCSQPNNNHCKAGMVGVVNPSGSMTLDAYSAAAKGSTSISSPPGAFGGVIGPAAAANGSTPTGGSGGASPTGSGGGGSSSGSPTPTGGAGRLTAGVGGLVGAAAFALFLV